MLFYIKKYVTKIKFPGYSVIFRILKIYGRPKRVLMCSCNDPVSGPAVRNEGKNDGKLLNFRIEPFVFVKSFHCTELEMIISVVRRRASAQLD